MDTGGAYLPRTPKLDVDEEAYWKAVDGAKIEGFVFDDLCVPSIHFVSSSVKKFDEEIK